jgi:signal recognition particle subunit SRP19
MVEKHDRIWVVYPEYFDSGITRHLGRKVRKELALQSPTLDELFDCAKNLNLSPVKEAGVAYPSFWWRRRGRLLVRKEWTKSETLEKLGKEYASYRETHGMPDRKNDGPGDHGKKSDQHRSTGGKSGKAGKSHQTGKSARGPKGKKNWKDLRKGKKGKGKR